MRLDLNLFPQTLYFFIHFRIFQCLNIHFRELTLGLVTPSIEKKLKCIKVQQAFESLFQCETLPDASSVDTDTPIHMHSYMLLCLFIFDCPFTSEVNYNSCVQVLEYGLKFQLNTLLVLNCI